MRPEEPAMSTVQYPTDLPITEVQGLISTIRAGSIVSDKKNFGKQLWIVQGYVQGVVLGDTVDAKASWNPFATNDEAPVLSNDDVAQYLEAAIENETAADGEVKQFIPIPWVSILKWAAKIVVTLLV